MKVLLVGCLCLIVLLLYFYIQRIVQFRQADAYQFSAQQVEAYHALMASDTDYYTEEFEDSFFAYNSRVLDVGCGDGRISALIAQRHPDCTVLGVDVSDEMINFAVRRYGIEHTNLVFAQKDARALEFTEAFDRVVSFYCLHWMRDQEKALRSIYRSLKQGGEAFIIVNPVAPQDHFQSCCRSVILSLRWLPYFLTFRSLHSMHTEDEYRQIVGAVGFTIKSMVLRESYLVLHDVTEAIRFLKVVLTPLSHLPEHKRQAFIDDFLTALAQHNGIDADGGIRIKVTQLELWIVRT